MAKGKKKKRKKLKSKDEKKFEGKIIKKTKTNKNSYDFSTHFVDNIFNRA